jgi:mannose-6-phosphate isomerase-like protein (cupin superfamily)
MSLQRILVIAASLIAAAPAFAAGDSFKHISQADAVAMLHGPKTKPGAAAQAIPITDGDHANFAALVGSRSKFTKAEKHNNFYEFLVVEDGTATYNYGGTLVNAKEGKDGNWGGGAISGGKSVQIHTGDFIEVPPGTPHQMIVKPGTTIRYVGFKARKD